MCRAHCAQTHIFVLANHAYARMCLKPGPGQVSTGRNLLKWSIWRCSTTRLCFWNISVPGFGHSFSGKANGAQLQSHPHGNRAHIPHLDTSLSDPPPWSLPLLDTPFPGFPSLFSDFLTHSPATGETKRCIFTCLCNGASFLCPVKPPTSVLSQKKLKNYHRSHAWLLLWQHHAFLHWI